jgi:hypothetical protein
MWFVDDNLHNHLYEALKHAVGDHAEFEVFPEPGEPIELMKDAADAGRLADVLPDVALIDVDFKSRASTGPIDKVTVEARGFVFAAELKHYAKEKKDLAYRIYTGNAEVRGLYRWLYDNPFEDQDGRHDGLLPISQKGDALSPFDVLEWAKEETYKLVRSRLPYVADNPRELCEWIDREKVAMESEWTGVWELSREDFETNVRPKIKELVMAWQESVSRDEGFGLRNSLPTDRLLKADSSGEITYALSLAAGPQVEEITRDLYEAARDFRKRNKEVLGRARDSAHERAEDFIKHSYFKKTIEPLFPFDAQEIKESGNPETIVNALKQILNLLSERLDHNFILMRAFKTVEVPGSDSVPEKIATTVFANACHRFGLEPKQWKFGFPQPGREDKAYIEGLLAEEVDAARDEKLRRMPLLRIPDNTLERIRRDGAAEDPDYPLFQFTSQVYPRRDHWEVVPAEYIRRYLPETEVIAPEGELSHVRVLTDWRRFFDPEAGLVARILAAEKEKVLGVKSVRVGFDKDCKTVLIDLDFLLKEDFYFCAINLTQPGGGLSGILKLGFLGWGQIFIHTNSENTCYVTPWPGGKPSDETGDTSRGVFRIEWSFRNYLRTRCPE